MGIFNENIIKSALIKKTLHKSIKQRMIYFRIAFLAFFLLFVQVAISGQGFNERIYQSYISGDMELWLKVMNEMEALHESIRSDDLLYDLAIAQYGYIAFSISAGKNDQAKEYLEMLEDNLELLENSYNEPAEIHALKGAAQGYKIGINPYKAVFFGRKAFNENNLAMELNPNIAQVWMEKGNIELYKPEIFNPNPMEAAAIYLKAIKLYESDDQPINHNWLYLNTLSSLATAYIGSGHYDKANRVYLKILEKEPDIEWIRDEVYPDFKRKHGF